MLGPGLALEHGVAIIVPLLLVGIAVLLMAGTHVLTKQREKKQAAE